MINSSFKEYYLKHKNKKNLTDLWNRYHKKYIQRGGYEPLFNKFKRDYIGYKDMELWDHFAYSSIFNQKAGSIFCDPQVVLVSSGFKNLEDINKNDTLFISLLIGLDEDNNGSLIYFNASYDLITDKINTKGDKVVAHYKKLDGDKIFKIDDHFARLKVDPTKIKLIQNKINKWIENNQSHIQKEVEKNCDNEVITKCINGFSDRFLEKNIKLCQKKIEDSQNLKVIEIPDQVEKGQCPKGKKPSPIESYIKRDAEKSDSDNKVSKKSITIEESEIDMNSDTHPSEKGDIPIYSYINNYTGSKEHNYLYPDRAPVHDRNWDNKKEAYNPPYFTLSGENDKDSILPEKLNLSNNNCLTLPSNKDTPDSFLTYWADPLDITLIPKTSEEIKDHYPWNKSYCVKNEILKVPLKERPSLTGKLKFDGGFPLNPEGKTGLSGRGCLPRWGANICISLAIILKDFRNNKWYVVLNKKGSNNITIPTHLLIKNNLDVDNYKDLILRNFLSFLDNIDEAKLEEYIPINIADKILENNHNKKPLYTHADKYRSSSSKKCLLALEYIIEKYLEGLDVINKIYSGYWADSKNTDNAWLESSVYAVNLNKKGVLPKFSYLKLIIELYSYSIKKNSNYNLYDLDKIEELTNLGCNKNDKNIISIKKILEITEHEDEIINRKKRIEDKLYSKDKDLSQKLFKKIKQLNKLHKKLKIDKAQLEKEEGVYNTNKKELDNLVKEILGNNYLDKKELNHLYDSDKYKLF